MRRLTLAVLLVLVTWPVSAADSAPTACLPASLRSTLASLQARFGRVQVVSTHRPGARVAGSGRRSLHASCRAVDFHPPRGRHRQVLAWLRQNHRGGVGTYSGRMRHIHIDDGPSVRFHHHYGSRRRR